VSTKEKAPKNGFPKGKFHILLLKMEGFDLPAWTRLLSSLGWPEPSKMQFLGLNMAYAQAALSQQDSDFE
jgi:hypothetical protein